MTPLGRRAFLSAALTLGGVAVLLLAGAGSARWPWGWGFLLAMGLLAADLLAWMARHAPDLLAERLHGIGHAAQPRWDRWWVLLVYSLAAAWLVGVAADAVRRTGDVMPLAVRLLGAVLVGAGAVVLRRTVHANAFLSPAVRVQPERGQVVVMHGPYAVVRHPMYAALLPIGVGSSLWLGSWLGVPGALVLWGCVLWRLQREEALLLSELPGYAAYVARVRHRVLPNLW